MVKMKNSCVLTLQRKNGKLILMNDKSSKWEFSNVDEETAIAALIFYTLKTRYNQQLVFSDNFKIKFSIEEDF